MAGVTRLRPAAALQGIHVQDQKCRRDRQIIVEIAQIDNAAGDALEARARAEQAQGRPRWFHRRNPTAHRCRPDTAPRTRRHCHQADDAVIGARGHEQADGEITAPQQQRGEIGGEHRSPVETRDGRHGKRQGQGGGQRQTEDGGAGQELAQRELPERNRQRQHVFERAAAPLFAPTAHGQRRAQEDQQQGHPLEQWTHIGDVAGRRRLRPRRR